MQHFKTNNFDKNALNYSYKNNGGLDFGRRKQNSRVARKTRLFAE